VRVSATQDVVAVLPVRSTKTGASRLAESCQMRITRLASISSRINYLRSRRSRTSSPKSQNGPGQPPGPFSRSFSPCGKKGVYIGAEHTTRSGLAQTQNTKKFHRLRLSYTTRLGPGFHPTGGRASFPSPTRL